MLTPTMQQTTSQREGLLERLDNQLRQFSNDLEALIKKFDDWAWETPGIERCEAAQAWFHSGHFHYRVTDAGLSEFWRALHFDRLKRTHEANVRRTLACIADAELEAEL